jgi:hypothetical protein
VDPQVSEPLAQVEPWWIPAVDARPGADARRGNPRGVDPRPDDVRGTHQPDGAGGRPELARSAAQVSRLVRDARGAVMYGDAVDHNDPSGILSRRVDDRVRWDLARRDRDLLATSQTWPFGLTRNPHDRSAFLFALPLRIVLRRACEGQVTRGTERRSRVAVKVAPACSEFERRGREHKRSFVTDASYVGVRVLFICVPERARSQIREIRSQPRVSPKVNPFSACPTRAGMRLCR